MNPMTTEIQNKQTLLASIAKARELELTESWEDTDQLAKEYLGQTAIAKDLATVESIVNFIKKLPRYEELVESARAAGMDLPRADTIETYQPGSIGWMRRLINLVI
jgi:hypothetical protein